MNQFKENGKLKFLIIVGSRLEIGVMLQIDYHREKKLKMEMVRVPKKHRVSR